MNLPCFAAEHLKEVKVDMNACMRRGEHMETLSSSLPPFIPLMPATCIMTKICISTKGAGKLLWLLQPYRLCVWSSVDVFLYPYAVVCVNIRHSFPKFPQTFSLLLTQDAESQHLKIDARLQQQQQLRSRSASLRWIRSHAAELKSSTVFFTMQNRRHMAVLSFQLSPPEKWSFCE